MNWNSGKTNQSIILLTMKDILLITCFACIAILFSTCTSVKQDSAQNSKDTLIGKAVTFPPQLLRMDGLGFSDLETFTAESKNKIKMISIIDGTCAACIINQMNGLDSVFNAIIRDRDLVVVFILNVSRNDSSYFMLNMQPAIKAKGIVLWDNSYSFERQNKLFTPDMNLRTFMVNRENRIIQYGNPLMHPDVIWEYKAKLASSGL